MIRENWRILALVFLIVLSGVALFVPGIGLGDDDVEQVTAGSTNLHYGLDLAGGTRIRAPLIGVTAEDVDIGDRSQIEVERAVADSLGEDAGNVNVRFPEEAGQPTALEVTSNVTIDEFTAALDESDVTYDPDRVRLGVSEETREQTIRVLTDKVDEAGLAGARVQTVFSTGENRHYVSVEVPQQNRSAVIDLVTARGQVRVLAYHETDDGEFQNRTVLRREDFQQIGIATRSAELGPHVPVVVESEDVDGDGEPEHERFQREMVETGVAQAGTVCSDWEPGTEPCLLTVVDGELVYSAGMSPDLGQSMVQETWANDPSFVLQTGSIEEARELAVHLRAGALPAQLAIGEGDVLEVSPTLGERFRVNSLLTAIITVFAVAFVVFIRYGDPRVAAPMVVTALSEAVILLGFAASVGLALDLSHIAGFIAVLGTGVDDLIIIADEVMAEGSVSSDRVFDNRFKKAFWIIGVAAATTIIAMSPLAILSLGDLRGFAIITILGVLVGVLVTRPAYGDILRRMLTDH